MGEKELVRRLIHKLEKTPTGTIRRLVGRDVFPYGRHIFESAPAPTPAPTPAPEPTPAPASTPAPTSTSGPATQRPMTIADLSAQLRALAEYVSTVFTDVYARMGYGQPPPPPASSSTTPAAEETGSTSPADSSSEEDDEATASVSLSI